MFPRRPILALALLAVCCFPLAASGMEKPWSTGPLRVSPNGRYLQTADGAPFFWIGDTAWRLFQRLTREETLHYLDDRRALGFNVIQVMIASNPNETNAAGAAAFLDGNPGQPITPPGGDYWDHIDWVLTQAEARGLYLAMLPAWCSLAKSALNEHNATPYLEFLTERFRRHPNIIWVNGGDCLGSDFPKLWRLMGETLKRRDPARLLTFHPFGGTSSSMWFHSEPWLDFNMFQSGHRRYDQVREAQKSYWKGEDGWRFVQEDLALSPPKPTLDAEPSYESIPQGLHDPSQPYWDDYHVRRYAYWSVFAGACGHTYGHNAVMQMHTPAAGRGAYGVRETWREALAAPGARHVPLLRRLILSRPFFERIPGQSLLAGPGGERYHRVIATRGAAYAFIYTFTGEPFTVRMGALSGRHTAASWFDPRTGQTRPIGRFRNRGNRTFTPPQPALDWVLVLDDASKRFSPPGQIPNETTPDPGHPPLR